MTDQPADQRCKRCRRPFDPIDNDPAGAARYAETLFCRGCVDRCHESTDAFHECPVCATATVEFLATEQAEPTGSAP